MTENIELSIEPISADGTPNYSGSAHQPCPEPLNVQILGDRYQFSLAHQIGQGMAGDVYVGIDKASDDLVCVKIIDRTRFHRQQQHDLLESEIKCQKKVRSQHTVKLLDVFDTSSFCFIITEHCEGKDLYTRMERSKSGLPEPQVLNYALDLAKALGHLKGLGIVHRDFKSQNILLKQGRAKLGDFGFAIQPTELPVKSKTNIGSPIYMALEVIERNQYSFASDIFAYGVVLYELFHKKSPWESMTEAGLIQKMKSQEPIFKPHISEALKNLIKGCLKLDPSNRISIEEILSSQVWQNVSDKENSVSDETDSSVGSPIQEKSSQSETKAEA